MNEIRMNITGTTLLDAGWPQGPAIGMALALAMRWAETGMTDAQIMTALEEVRRAPETFLGDGEVRAGLASALRAQAVPERAELREVPVDAPVWGESIIDPGAVQQLRNAMCLPVTVAGALMPDAHIGYGIPIGGVVALEGAVAPYMVGVDIACRMMMTAYRIDPDKTFANSASRDMVKRIMRDETRFGIGASFGPYERRRHDVLDDPDWGATKFLGHLKDKAHAQLGTSGTGNHFVDAGVLTVDQAGSAALGIEPGRYLAIMSHSGSRGVGANIADHFSRLAQRNSGLPDQFRHLAWLDLDTEVGEEYWVSMNLAGRFASACHHEIHRAIGKRLGERPAFEVENHHNFAWLEEWQGRTVVVHRKGATPAHEGVLGIIPGSQGHDSFIVRGKGNPASLNSASHGAGRRMSRKQAKESIPKRERDTWLKERGVELLAGGMDEAPQAYKDIAEVLALQTDLVEPMATFTPRLVLMANDGKAED